MTVRLVKGFGNHSVAWVEGRKFPGVLIQGDTLCSPFWKPSGRFSRDAGGLGMPLPYFDSSHSDTPAAPSAETEPGPPR